MKQQKVLILYTELAAYTLACIGAFARAFPAVKVCVVRWPVNNEAPFVFDLSILEFRDRNTLSDDQLVEFASHFSPDLIVCSGWKDKGYLRVCKKVARKIPVVMAMDNKWEGRFKQRVGAAIARFTFLKNFSHAWVTGNAQRAFALRLGFDDRNIRTGFYSADVEAFAGLYDQRNAAAKRFIYAGRYYEFKGVKELWEAFIRLKKETNTEWELWCAGTGDVKPIESEGIKHFGFVQPARMKELMKESSVFILPSRVEPWAVVVHEFAAAGFPLLLSNEVGAREKFLAEGENGFSFEAGSAEPIYAVMKKIIEMPEEKLVQMGRRSIELSETITPVTWADTLNELLNSNPR